MRVGLTQRVMEIAGRGERRDTLDQRWMGFAKALGVVPFPLPNLADADYVQALALDALILTGGNNIDAAPTADGAPERDAFERRLLDDFAARNLPVIGVCRGFQMLQRHAGGALVPIQGHAGPRHAIAWPGGTPAAFQSANVNSYHDFGIAAPAGGYRALAHAPDGSVEAVTHDSLPWLGVMWHPEREAAPAAADLALLRHFLNGDRL